MRPRKKLSRVELLPVTQMLIEMLDTLTVPERHQVCLLAKVPYTSLSAWRNGLYHPTLSAATRLAQAMGCELDLVETDAPQ